MSLRKKTARKKKLASKLDYFKELGRINKYLLENVPGARAVIENIQDPFVLDAYGPEPIFW